MQRMQILVTVLMLLAASCPTPSPLDAGGDDGSDGSADAARDAGLGDAYAPACDLTAGETPILERTAPIAYTCTAGAPSPVLERGRGYKLVSLAASDTGIYAAWIGASDALNFAAVDGNGYLGTPTTLVASNAMDPHLVWHEGLFSVVWSTQSTSDNWTLWFARFDSFGAMAVAPKSLTQSELYSVRAIDFVRGASAYGILYWYGETTTDGLYYTLEFLRFDDAGNRLASATRLVEGAHQPDSISSNIFSLVARDSGFAAAWQGEPGIVFVALDAMGQPLAAPRVISRAGIGSYEPHLITHGNEIWSVWDEICSGANSEMIVRLARLDLQGQLIGGTVPLQHTESRKANVQPFMIDLGSTVALTWSYGSYRGGLGGPFEGIDNVIRFVVIDPATLAPVSAVVELGLGVDTPRLSHRGIDFRVLMNRVFHADFIPQIAALSCTQ